MEYKGVYWYMQTIYHPYVWLATTTTGCGTSPDVGYLDTAEERTTHHHTSATTNLLVWGKPYHERQSSLLV